MYMMLKNYWRKYLRIHRYHFVIVSFGNMFYNIIIFINIEALLDLQNQQAYYTYIPMGLSSGCYLNDYVL